MPLAPGMRLGPYEIVSLLGQGGMGEVYRARDPRLNRDVAIKTSRVEFNDRFLREARAVAALNHPNICHLYDVGPNYLVTELIEGKTARPTSIDCPREDHPDGKRFLGRTLTAADAPTVNVILNWQKAIPAAQAKQ